MAAVQPPIPNSVRRPPCRAFRSEARHRPARDVRPPTGLCPFAVPVQNDAPARCDVVRHTHLALTEAKPYSTYAVWWGSLSTTHCLQGNRPDVLRLANLERRRDGAARVARAGR